MTLNPKKTYLVIHQEVLLDYVVSESGRESKLEKIRIIYNFKPLMSMKEVQRVLGHVSWY